MAAVREKKFRSWTATHREQYDSPDNKEEKGQWETRFEGRHDQGRSEGISGHQLMCGRKGIVMGFQADPVIEEELA